MEPTPTTPPLVPSEEKHPPRAWPWRALLLGAGLGALGAVLGVWIVQGVLPAGFARQVSPWGWLLLAGALVAAILLPLPVHELGHLAGGLLVGFRPVLFVVGPLRLQRTGAGLELGLNRSLDLAGGMALSSPRRRRGSRWRTIVMVAAGPLVSLAAGVATLVAVTAAARPTAGGGPLVDLLRLVAPWTFGLVSLGIAAVTALPGRFSGFLTDGRRIALLMAGGPGAERDVAVMALVAASLAGQRPREWSAEWVEGVRAPADAPGSEAAARSLAYAHLMDRGDLEGARDELQRLVDGLWEVPAATRDGIRLEAAFFEALGRHDADATRRWLQEAGAGPRVDRAQQAAAEAALAWLENDADAYRTALGKARRLLASDLDRGAATARLDWITRPGVAAGWVTTPTTPAETEGRPSADPAGSSTAGPDESISTPVRAAEAPDFIATEEPPPMPSCKRIVPELRVADLDRAVDFYTGTVGFRENWRRPGTDGGERCMLQAGAAWVLLTAVPAGAAAALTGTLYFDTDGVAELYERLRNHVDVAWPLQAEGGMREFGLRDPDGYTLAFIEEAEDESDSDGA